MSVMSETFGYDESCCKSHEFLRRACTKTSKGVAWAGDLLVQSGIIIKQSEINDMRGGNCDTEIQYPKPQPSCEAVTSGIPKEYTVEETSIRTGGRNTFQYIVPKNENPEEESNWEIGIYQSTNDCGILMDGGDAYQSEQVFGSVDSICGTIHRQMPNPSAHFLDNRVTLEDDPDNGLLFAIRDGMTGIWEVRYSPAKQVLTTGLSDSDDASSAFTTALSALGMTHQDVFEFGMI